MTVSRSKPGRFSIAVVLGFSSTARRILLTKSISRLILQMISVLMPFLCCPRSLPPPSPPSPATPPPSPPSASARPPVHHTAASDRLPSQRCGAAHLSAEEARARREGLRSEGVSYRGKTSGQLQEVRYCRPTAQSLGTQHRDSQTGLALSGPG